MINFLGQSRKINAISTLDLQSYKRMLQKSAISVYRLNLHISILKALFHWARKNDILANIPNIDAISRGKIIHKERFTFESEHIAKLLSNSDVKMKAMIWLGLNCGFGCTDCAELKWSDLDLALWPETVAALGKIPKKGKLVFYTSRGNPYIQTKF